MPHSRVFAALTGLATITAASVSAAEPPRLVVLLSVDQLRADYLERGRESFSGGLERLLGEGAWFRNAAFTYSHTVTCAGHATLATGMVPARHGMVLNGWWEHPSGRVVPCTEDASLQNRPLVPGRPPDGPGDGPGRLLASTLADVLRLARDGRVASFSLKARSAITLAGQRAGAIAWLGSDGRWLTSSHYDPPPAGLVEAAAATGPATDAGRVWERRLPSERYSGRDDVPWERPPEGWGAAFPHALSSVDDPALVEQWMGSPFSDAALVRLALAAVEELELGADPGRTDLLAVSFSALDHVGHDFGPASHEVQDLLLHLDASLGELLAGLDASVGEGHWVLGLSADHGVAPVPEHASALGLNAGRLAAEEVAAVLDAALSERLGPGQRVAASTHTDFYLVPGVWDRLREEPRALEAALEEVRRTPGVERVFTRDQLVEGGAGRLDATGRRVAASFHPDRSGDLVMVWSPYWISSSSATTHGTSRSYDRRVPLVLAGRGVAPGRYSVPASPTDLAPTLAFLAGVTLSETDGRILAEALVD